MPGPNQSRSRTDTLARIAVKLEGPSEYRGTEIIGDLRVIAETLYYPSSLSRFGTGRRATTSVRRRRPGYPAPTPQTTPAASPTPLL